MRGCIIRRLSNAGNASAVNQSLLIDRKRWGSQFHESIGLACCVNSPNVCLSRKGRGELIHRANRVGRRAFFAALAQRESGGVAMQYRRMGRSGLKLSAVSLGAWATFGERVGRSEARELR